MLINVEFDPDWFVFDDVDENCVINDLMASCTSMLCFRKKMDTIAQDVKTGKLDKKKANALLNDEFGAFCAKMYTEPLFRIRIPREVIQGMYKTNIINLFDDMAEMILSLRKEAVDFYRDNRTNRTIGELEAEYDRLRDSFSLWRIGYLLDDEKRDKLKFFDKEELEEKLEMYQPRYEVPRDDNPFL